MINLRVSEAAAISIIEQAEYYRAEANDALVLRWESAVDEAVLSLQKQPERGARCRFRSTSLAGLRWIFIPGFSRHMLFYRYIPEQTAIVIVQVLHGAQDLETVMDEGE
jgi:plasmid stabilization system protein ParE